MALRSVTVLALAASAAASRILAPLKAKADVAFQSTFLSEDKALFASSGTNRYWSVLSLVPMFSLL